MIWLLFGSSAAFLIAYIVILLTKDSQDEVEDEEDTPSPPDCCQPKKTDSIPDPSLNTTVPTTVPCRLDSVEAERVGEAAADAVIIVIDAIANSVAKDKLPPPDYAPVPCDSFDNSSHISGPPATTAVAEVSESFSYDPPAPESAGYSSGSSYDSGSHDCGSSDYGSSDYDGSSDCGGDW